MQYVTIPHAVMRADGMPANAVQVLASEGPMQGVDSVDRMGDIVAAAGLRLHEIGARGLPVLAQHDAASPIARATRVWRSGDRIMAHVEFPPTGTSAKSDEYLGLVKSGVVDAVSIGFLPHKSEPLRGGGLRFTDWSLLEISFVSIAALPSARVTAKADRAGDGFAGRAGLRLNAIMKECHRAPVTSPSGR